MEIKGTIVDILPLESGVGKSTGKPWSKGTIVIETDGQYPKKVAISNMKQAEEFIRLPKGARGTFRIDISSQEYKGRWFTSVNCFSYELEGQQVPPQQQSPQSQQAHPQPQYQAPPTDDQDLPF